MKVENMNNTAERVNNTPKVEDLEAVNAVFPDNVKNNIATDSNLKFGKVAMNQEPIENNANNGTNPFVDYRNRFNNFETDPTKIPLEIGNLLAKLRKDKANEVL